jgi:transposase
VLPLHVHQGLGLSAFVVGLVTGSQFAASLISRVWSGHYADSRGASRGRIASRLANVPPCLIGIEAGMATHYVARELAALGHDVKQVPPTYAKPFRQGHKRCGIAWSASGPQ